ncbi:MAG: hypothetical protein QOD83_5034 [Solirubrobacteraceae bacterium]|nr:hypothetical protein [Solirubrobacteraceae bacterium]
MEMQLPPALSNDYLTIYLNDHLGGSTFGIELVKHLAATNRDTEFEPPLSLLVTDIESDRDELLALIERLGRTRDPMKVALGWTAEKVRRLKPNGRMVGYSPLTRLLELEMLEAGITGKLGLWQALRAVSDQHAELDPGQLERLAKRADEQRGTVSQLHQRAAQLALGPSTKSA